MKTVVAKYNNVDTYEEEEREIQVPDNIITNEEKFMDYVTEHYGYFIFDGCVVFYYNDSFLYSVHYF